MHVGRVHADLIVKAYSSVGEIHSLVYTVVSGFMREADKNGLGVVGIYSSVSD